MDDPTAQAAHLDRIRELEAALRFYSDAFPAFRGKPVGAPGISRHLHLRARKGGTRWRYEVPRLYSV
jgi:hypothetical protein